MGIDKDQIFFSKFYKGELEDRESQPNRGAPRRFVALGRPCVPRMPVSARLLGERGVFLQWTWPPEPFSNPLSCPVEFKFSFCIKFLPGSVFFHALPANRL